MQWVPLNTKQLRAAAYDADRQQLFVKTGRGTIRKHTGVLPHMYENLLSTDEKQFYYRVYIEPGLVSDRRGVASIAGYVLKLGVVGAGALLLSSAL